MSENIVYQTTINSQGHELSLYKREHGLVLISSLTDQPSDFTDQWLAKKFNDYQIVTDDQLFDKERTEVSAYLAGDLTEFDFRIDLHGTPFQKDVWRNLTNIPYGETVSYSELAQSMNRPTAVRAISRAIGQNPLLIVVPCHRVIGKNNKLTGFRSGLALKKELIDLESGIS